MHTVTECFSCRSCTINIAHPCTCATSCFLFAAQQIHLLTHFLSENLQVGDSLIFKELDAIDAVEAVVLDHEQGGVDAEAVQHGALPLGQRALLPPAVLDASAQQVVGIWSETVAQLATAALPDERRKRGA